MAANTNNTRSNRVLNAVGFARVLARGVRANFAPENHKTELQRLADLCQDMAMSLEMEAEASDKHAATRKMQDADFLGAVACHLREDEEDESYGDNPTNARHTIDIVDDLMVVLDQDGNGCDLHELCGLREAKRTLRRWQDEYTFDYAEALRAVSAYFANL